MNTVAVIFETALLRRDGADNSTSTADEDTCNAIAELDRIGLRVGMLFIILVTSLFGTLFPVVSKRVTVLRNHVPALVFEFAKFFGSGVILTTGFVHLLEPAADGEIGVNNTVSAGGCISDAWAEYPYAFGICLVSLYVAFVMELLAFRWGTQRLQKIGLTMGDGHGDALHEHGHIIADGAILANGSRVTDEKKVGDEESFEEFRDASESLPAVAQIISVAVLEFGVIFHSIIIGLTLALATDEFNVLCIVIIFHQMFEGLGLGSRLAFLQLPARLGWVPFAAAAAYSIVTPLGMAIGLGAKATISMSSANAQIASGILDSISAGILIYTATVELIAHEFVFNKTYHDCSTGKLIFALTCFALGAGLMALLGKWA